MQTLRELDQDVMRDNDAISVVSMARLQHVRRTRREASGLPPVPPGHGIIGIGVSPFDAVALRKNRVDPFVELVRREGWDDFGFVLYRAGYEDNESWQQWVKAFGELLDRSISESKGGDSVTDKCLIPLIEGEPHQLESFHTIQR